MKNFLKKRFAWIAYLFDGETKVTSPDGEVLKSLKAGTGSPDLKSGAGQEPEEVIKETEES